MLNKLGVFLKNFFNGGHPLAEQLKEIINEELKTQPAEETKVDEVKEKPKRKYTRKPKT